MRKLSLILLLCLSTNLLFAKGLRHSVCQVTPEYTEQEKKILNDMAFIMSRTEKPDEARYLLVQSYLQQYGSGVVVNKNGKCLLTSRNAVGYAKQVTVTVYLHDKTLRFPGCKVLGSDVASNLALVALPDNDELEPLVIATQPQEEGVEITSAGYTILNGKANWQMVRGIISNAQVHFAQGNYIQHTAPNNMGVAGGPILTKTESGYQIVGVNIGGVTHRDEVTLAVPATDILGILSNENLHNDNADLLSCKELTLRKVADTWKYLKVKEIDEYKKAVSVMPLDLFLGTLAKKSFFEDRDAQETVERLAKRGVVNDISTFKQSVFYHNYISAANQEAGISIEAALGKRKMGFVGLQFSTAFVNARPISKDPIGGGWGYVNYKLYDPKPVFTPLFGIYAGYQLPIRVGDKHVLVPRLSQGGNLGPCVNTYDAKNDKYSVGTLLVTSDSRVGLEYHYQLDKIALIVGVEYTAHIFSTGADVMIKYTNNTQKPVDDHTKLLFENKNAEHLRYNSFNHGVGARFAIGF